MSHEGRELRVLIVEDSPDDASLMLRQLERGGFAPDWARVETAEGLEAALAEKAWEVVLCDYALPSFTGLDALQIVRRRANDLPFVLVSGYIGEELAAEAIRSGADDYLLKDRLGRLSHAVARLLREAEAKRVRSLAERRTQAAHAFLADAGAALAASLEFPRILHELARVAAPPLGDWCFVLVRFEEVVEKAAAHADPAKREVMTRLCRTQDPRLAGQGLGRVLRSGQTQVENRMRDSDLAHWLGVSDPEVMRLAGGGALLALPLRGRSETFGVVALGASSRTYDASDLWLAEEFVRRAALSVENAWLYRQAQIAIGVRDEFLSIASHELRTPLTPLHLELDLIKKTLRKAGSAGEQLRARLDGASRAANRLTRLVDALLDVSRISTGQMVLEREEIDLSSLVRETAARFSLEAGQAGGTLLVHAAAPVVGFWDRLRIEQAVANLIANAIKYGEGKPVEVRVEAVERTARIAVRDRGMGIGPEDVKRVFGRFERAVSARHFGGLGLGLFIARQVVEAHGGEIIVESEKGAGSTFTIVLPVRPAAAIGSEQMHA